MKSENRPDFKEKFALLYEVSKAIVSNRYLEEILSVVVALTAQLMDSKICLLMLLDDKKQELVIQATQSLSERYRNKPPIKVGQSISGRVVETKRPITVRDVTQEAMYSFPEIARAEGLKSLVSVPMMIKGRVIGVLNCYTATERDFDDDDVQNLITVANQAAVAIENTKLLAEKVEAIESLETRKKVERAKAILMKKHKLEENEAYRMLQKQSMEKRKTMAQIAEAIILSEDLSL